MNRREFLKHSFLLGAGVLVGKELLAGESFGEAARKQKIIGLQLYSLRDAMSNNVPGTLSAVGQMGYDTLETAGYGDGKLYGYSAKEFRKMVEDNGMKVTGAHLGQDYTKATDAKVMEWWKQALDTQAEVGCKYAVQPSFPIGKSLDDIKLYCDYFNQVGEMANTKGLKFGFHNHDGEFKTIDGQIIYDYMLANTDPDKVMYELDVYWATKAGKDPVEYINKYSSRIPLLHIKDECAVGESGTIDFEPIFKAANKNKMEAFYVEVEKYTQGPEQDVQRSFHFLDSSKFVK